MKQEEIESYVQQVYKLIRDFRALQFSIPEHAGLRNSEKFILMLIMKMNEGKGVKPSEIAKRLDITVGAVTHHINALQKQGLVLKKTDEFDKRSFYVLLSQKGKAKLEEVREENMQKLSKLIEYLGKEDSAKFIDLLEKVFGYIKDQKNCEIA